MLAALLVAAFATPTPSPKHHAVSIKVSGGITFVSQSAVGPGAFPEEIERNFTYPPQAPYEFFTQTPTQPGNSAQADLGLLVRYDIGVLRVSLETAGTILTGNANNLYYLSRPILPSINPFVNNAPTGLINPSFAQYPGQFETDLARSSILSGSVEALNGAWRLTGGWFLPQHSLPFVFSAPPSQNSVPAIAPVLPESPSAPLQSVLPLQGLDATAQGPGHAFEFFTGTLPIISYGAGKDGYARAWSAIASFPAAHDADLTLQVSRISEGTVGGNVPLSAGVLWGAGADTAVGPEGPQPESDTFGQHTTIAGLRFVLHPSARISVLADFAQSWFAAQFFSSPGLPTPGTYAHLGVDGSWGASGASLDLYRFSPTYAPNILPYASPPNLWPVAWAWPAPWLKFVYPVADTSQIPINRQGFRVEYRRQIGHFDGRLAVNSFAQVTPFNSETALLPGFTDTFFTSLVDQPLSFRGTQTQYAGSFAWHAGAYVLSLDAIDDTVHRPFPSIAPEEAVDLHVPQEILTLSHSAPDVTYALGEGRFGVRGAYALGSLDSVDVHQLVFFAGIEAAAAPHSSWLLEWRRYITDGIPISGDMLPPSYTGTRLILQQRFAFQ